MLRSVHPVSRVSKPRRFRVCSTGFRVLAIWALGTPGLGAAVLGISGAVLVGVAAVAGAAEEPASRTARFSEKVLSLVRAVEAHHADHPPIPRLLGPGIAEVCRDARMDASPWIQGIADQPGDRELRSLLEEFFDRATEAGVLDARVIKGVTGALFAAVPGGVTPISPDAARVHESLEANRYVGVGVVYRMVEGRPQVVSTFFGGPAHEGGLRDGDLVYELDGRDTATMDLAAFTKYARGPAGTEVTYVVGRPNSSERRAVTLTRREVPRETVRGHDRDAEGGWIYCLPGTRAAHLRIESLTASTAHELFRAAPRIARERAEAVVLDLRRCGGSEVHSAVLVLDALLQEGILGKTRDGQGERVYRAGPDSLFFGLQLSVLIGPNTFGSAEWLAENLSRAGRAELIGAPTAGSPGIYTIVQVPGWKTRFRMAAGWFLASTRELEDSSAGETKAFAPGPLSRVQPQIAVPEPEGDALTRALVELGRRRSERREG